MVQLEGIPYLTEMWRWLSKTGWMRGLTWGETGVDGEGGVVIGPCGLHETGLIWLLLLCFASSRSCKRGVGLRLNGGRQAANFAMHIVCDLLPVSCMLYVLPVPLLPRYGRPLGHRLD